MPVDARLGGGGCREENRPREELELQGAGTGSSHTRAPRSIKGRSRYVQGSRRVDSVGEELNANGHFTSYKRKRATKKGGSGVERTKCCRTDSELPSLFLFSLCFCSIASVAGFRGGSRCFEERPCTSGSTSDLFSCSVRRSEQRSASVRRPVRSFLIRAHRGL